MKWLALRFRQKGMSVYQTAPKVSDLLEKWRVDIWRPEMESNPEEQGYQREPTRSHYAKIAEYLRRDEAIMPTSGLISLRSKASFTPLASGDGLEVGWLDIPEHLPLFVVDGQHRLAGFEKAITEDGYEELADFNLPVNILENVGKVTEVVQFLILNTTAKRVQTNLAWTLLRQLADRDEVYADEAVREGRDWRNRAIDLARHLNSRVGSPWYSRIRKPNGDKLETVVTESTFVDSLRPLLAEGFLSTLLTENQLDSAATIVDNFWGALRMMLPEAFKNPIGHSIQKTPGIYTLHQVAPRVIEHCRNAGDFSVAFMKGILDHAESYLTEDFWVRGGDGAAFTNRGAQRQLAHRILVELPQVSLSSLKLT